jgi:hypothetical protein
MDFVKMHFLMSDYFHLKSPLMMMTTVEYHLKNFDVQSIDHFLRRRKKTPSNKTQMNDITIMNRWTNC